MGKARLLLAALGLLTTCSLVGMAWADEAVHGPPVVIDTDLGLDDAAALAMALQSPDLHVEAVVACWGACDGGKAVELLRRMLWEFNRADVALYEPAAPNRSTERPAFRSFVEQAFEATLPQVEIHRHARAFAPHAYAAGEGKTTILALGPLTNVAAALRVEPGIKTAVERIVVAGWADVGRNWNLGYDCEAYRTVRGSGIPMVFVGPKETAATKPPAWMDGELDIGPDTAVGERFFRRLLAPDDVRKHYVTQLGWFHDELALLYVVSPSIFQPSRRQEVVVPTNAQEVVGHFTLLLSEGRQRERHVVLTDDPLPASALRPDVRGRRQRIVARHGRTEWFAQLLMNELHQHLGAYSVIGVKMGLRAAEVLNAPQHAMTIVSHAAPGPPVSCLNDGIIVATGCTPGRALFSQGKSKGDRVEAEFTYNGRTATLVLKDAYRDQVRRSIQALRRKNSLEDQAYWDGVREFGLDIWENWSRSDVFTVTVTAEQTDRDVDRGDTETAPTGPAPLPQHRREVDSGEHSHGSGTR